MIQKKYLTNVAIIRPFLILLLVFYHAFAPYSGAWKPIDGFPDVSIYWWLDKLSYAFLLEMFVLISGYVFGYQVRIKGETKLEAKSLFWGKFKRLMIPCMVFSLLYILLFENIKQPVTITLYSLLNGTGHMWFLPMLFWCFAGIWVIEKLKLKSKIIIPVLIVCSVFSFVPPLPLRMSKTLYFMLFFYVGYYLQRDNISTERFYTIRHVILTFVAFCVLFPSLTLMKGEISSLNTQQYFDNHILSVLIITGLSQLMQIVYSSVGLLMLFIFVGYIEKKRSVSVKTWVVKLGNLCFGVYLIQQFILKVLYGYTNFPTIFGCYWLPWVSFIITLFLSVFLSRILVKTRLGFFLIG